MNYAVVQKKGVEKKEEKSMRQPHNNDNKALTLRKS